MRSRHGPKVEDGGTPSRSVYLPELAQTLRPAEVLLIVPPFGDLHHPSLAVHLLQASCRKIGLQVQTLYANFVLAHLIGEKVYEKVCTSSTGSFAGERFFARCAYGTPALGRHSNDMFEWSWEIPGGDGGGDIEPEFDRERPIALRELRRLEARADDFIETVARAINKLSYRVVGCTTSFEQTSASVALLNRVKLLKPETITVLGGANCEGEMARGIASLKSSIDYVFSGDSETTFVESVRAILAGSRPREHIIRGDPCTDMDALATPSFTDFYEQRRNFLPRSSTAEEDTEILYETSRGCWWGQKQHCTYCGIPGEGVLYRQKSPDRVIEELRALLRHNPTKKVMMTDNIMPSSYFNALLPRFVNELPAHSIFYEQRANLSLSNILTLKKAGIDWIQPGIEALSSRLLKLVGKGVQARENLTLLRYARASGMQVSWNLLWGFPGDKIEAYQETLAIVRLLHHLPPPEALIHVVIDRFSPYFSRPAQFGVHNLTPISCYCDFLPRKADVRRIAYHFTADYECGSHTQLDVIRMLWRELEKWRLSWGRGTSKPSEELRIVQSGNAYI